MSDAPINIDAVRKWLDTPLFPHLPGHAPVAAIRGLCDEVVSLRAENAEADRQWEEATEQSGRFRRKAECLRVERDAALARDRSDYWYQKTQKIMVTLTNVRAERDAWHEYCDAKDALMATYRTGRQLTEKTMRRLDRTRAAIPEGGNDDE